MINPGELSKRIIIKQYESDTDNDGYPLNTTTVVCTPWAKVTRTSGTELQKAGADMGVVKVRFLIRYNPKITRKMLIEYNGIDYQIKYINDYEEKHEIMEIWTEVATNGEV